jgi:hypothetical protein
MFRFADLGLPRIDVSLSDHVDLARRAGDNNILARSSRRKPASLGKSRTALGGS